MTKSRHTTVARIKTRILLCCLGERVIPAVEVTNVFTELTIAGRASKRFNVAVLVWRHTLLAELTANPIGGLSQQHSFAHPGCGQRSSTAAQTAADDDNIHFDFVTGIAGIRTGRSSDLREIR